MVTILFISLSAAQNNLEAEWAEGGRGPILRQCPICLRDSIIGHGRRRKQAHDEDHDWIGTRRGLCNLCGKTFTFLPPFSLPYCHYSLIARSQALRRYFVEGYSWEASAPTVRDPQRVADPSTLRRWFRSLDCSRPAFSFLRPTMRAVSLGVAGRQESCRWQHVAALATPFLLLESVLAIAALKKAEPPTILAWDFRRCSLTLDRERETAPWVTIWNG